MNVHFNYCTFLTYLSTKKSRYSRECVCDPGFWTWHRALTSERATMID